MSDPTRQDVALIGAGHWGRNLARVLHELGRLRVVCDATVSVAEDIAASNNARPQSRLNDVLADPAISAVVVATPAATHADIVEKALLADKDVFVEKPIALQETDATNIAQLARRQDRVLMVGHLLQYHPAFTRLKELVESGELGRLNYVYSHRLNFGKIRSEENILWSFAPHDISMILSLAGAMPETVEATGHAYLHHKIMDTTTTHMEFASGLRAHIFVSWLHPYKEQKLVVVGDRSMAVFDDTEPLAQKLQIYPHSIDWQHGAPIPIKAAARPIVLAEAEPLRAEMEHFLACCASRAQPRSDADEAIRVLKVLNAAQKSADTARSRATAVPLEGVAPPVDANLVHDTAVIDKDVEIGAGSRIWHFSHILSNTRIGRDCVIGQNVMIGGHVTVGDRCKIQNNVSVFQGVTLEDEVFCGPSCVFTNVLTPRATVDRKNEFLPTVVETGATIGANATIVCGNRIGHHAMVGAGAVVTKEVPPHALVVGNPARQIGWVSEAGERLGDDLICPRTGIAHTLSDSGRLTALAPPSPDTR